MAERTAATNAYAAKPLTIMEKEVSAAAQLARDRKDEAVRLAKEAADIELTLNAPSGPPDPIKPALELYGEVLLAAGRPPKPSALSSSNSCARPTARRPCRAWPARASKPARNSAANSSRRLQTGVLKLTSSGRSSTSP